MAIAAKQDNPPVLAAWLAHAKGEFSRELWNGGRSSKWARIDTPEQYLSFVSACYDSFAPYHTSLYPSAIPDSPYGAPYVDHLMIEPECRTLEESHKFMRRLVAHIKLEYECDPRVYFSGNKSFHVYADFLPLVIDRPFDRLRVLAERISKTVGFTPDWAMYTPRKLSRMPYSYHEDTCAKCVPISAFWALEEVKRAARRPSAELVETQSSPPRVRHSSRVRTELALLDLPQEPKPRTLRRGIRVRRYDWVEELLARPIDDGRHRILWHVLSPYLLNVRKLDLTSAEAALREYFEECGKVEPLQPSRSQFFRQIKQYLRVAQKDGFPPWRLETIERKDPQLFAIVREATSA